MDQTEQPVPSGKLLLETDRVGHRLIQILGHPMRTPHIDEQGLESVIERRIGHVSSAPLAGLHNANLPSTAILAPGGIRRKRDGVDVTLRVAASISRWTRD